MGLTVPAMGGYTQQTLRICPARKSWSACTDEVLGTDRNMSDRAIPRSLRTMEGFGVHTFRLTNAAGETSLVKFHWKPKAGVHSLTWEEAQMTAGLDPDFHRRDLADAIEAGAFPQWDFGIQVFADTPEEMFEGIDLLDPTKFVPEELAPVQVIGTMTLTANPINYFAETEQVAFHPGHLVAGIDVTNDPLLQGRLFSYIDTQFTRLGGPNFGQIPINRAHASVNDMLRDGFHQDAVHAGVAPYRPNSLDGGCPFVADDASAAFIDVPQPLPAAAKVRDQAASFDDHFSQARLFFQSLQPVEQEHAISAYTCELAKCYEENVKIRQLQSLANIDQRLCAEVAQGLGLAAPDATEQLGDQAPSPALSQITTNWPVAGRQVGIIADDTTNLDDLNELRAALHTAGMVPLVVSPHGGKTGRYPRRAAHLCDRGIDRVRRHRPRYSSRPGSQHPARPGRQGRRPVRPPGQRSANNQNRRRGVAPRQSHPRHRRRHHPPPKRRHARRRPRRHHRQPSHRGRSASNAARRPPRLGPLPNHCLTAAGGKRPDRMGPITLASGCQERTTTTSQAPGRQPVRSGPHSDGKIRRPPSRLRRRRCKKRPL